jgi:hypothetical protein
MNERSNDPSAHAARDPSAQTNPQPPATGRSQSPIGHPPSVIGHPSSAIRHRPSAIGHPPSVIRHLSYARRVTVRYEQAVYGSFAFRGGGYAMLAHSPGCRPEWLADFRAACQRIGERPAGAADAPGLFALRLPSGPWAVVGVSPQGCDDRGRPGALGFHALFLAPRSYRKLSGDPFALAGALRSDWTAGTSALPSVVWTVGPDGGPDSDASDPRAGPIAAALARGRRVAVEAPGPIDELARQVWRTLPRRVRVRASVATWAFGNGNRFDLVAVPRLAGVPLDASYVDPAALADVEPPAGLGRWLRALLGRLTRR